MTLVYPYFQPPNDSSIFRFPPLGLGYIAAYLRNHGISAEIVDCTFLSQTAAVEKIRKSNPEIIGIQSMYSLKNKTIQLARLLRKHCNLLVVGGPLATVSPESFLQDFDIAVIGEGEKTMLEIVLQFEKTCDYSKVNGIAYRDKATGQIKRTPKRKVVDDLDSIPSPSRDLFDNSGYKEYYFRKFGYTISTIMTSRGCPFSCDFCSKPVFGNELRVQTASKVADEIEEVIAQGYDRIWFADDCFTLDRKRLCGICDEINRRDLKIVWECLSRVDTLDLQLVQKMKRAGCIRMFFGLESGNDSILSLMNKQITTKQMLRALSLCREAGVKAGAFFIVGYPGESDETVLDTVNFASSLPLDYLSFTLPYPIPGTPLHERVKEKMILDEWNEGENLKVVKHSLVFNSNQSEFKLKFAIIKGTIQFRILKDAGKVAYRVFGKFFEGVTNYLFKKMR